MAGLTLQQLQQMGAQPVQNTQPTQKSGGLTLQQLQQMGGKPATETRKSRMEQGLPVSSEARFARTGKAEPSDGGNLARSILNPVARVASTFNAIGQGVQELKSSQPNIANIGQPMKSQYFGSVDPLGYRKGKQLSPGQDLKDTLGVGLEAASFLPVGTGANLARQVATQPFKQGLKTTAKAFGREGLLQGATGEAGRSMQEGDTFGQTLGKTALGGAIGGVAGVGLGVGGQALTRAFTKLPQEQIKQKAIEATSKALGISGKRPVKQAMAQPEQYTKGLATVRKYADNFDPKNSDSVFDDTVKGLVTAKDKVFQTYNDIAQQAGDAGVFVDTNPLQDSLTKYVSGITTAPKKQRAIRLLRELQDNFPNGKASPLEMQQYIKLLNEELGGIAGGAERGAVGVVSDFTRQARESLDNAVGRLGKEYQSFKDEYASLKAIEDSLVRQYQKVMRKKGSGLGEYADMISNAEVLNGIISGNPALIAKGGVMRFLSSKIKSLNDPETWLKRAFDEIDKAGDVFTPQARNGTNKFGSREQELVDAMKKRADFYKEETKKVSQPLSKEDEEYIKMVGGDQAFGAIAGIERDEEGNIKFNPEKAALGLGVMGSIKSKAGQNLLKKVGNKMKGVSDDLIQEAKKYKSAEEFVKAQPTYYHGTPEKTFKLDSNKPLFLTDNFDSANTYAGYSYDTKPTGRVVEVRLKDGRTLDLNNKTTAKKVFNEMFNTPENKKLFNEIPEEVPKINSYGENTGYLSPRESLGDFQDWLWEKFPSSENKAIRSKYIEAFRANAQPTRNMVYDKWNEIIDYAKKKGYDFIDHTTEDPSASILFKEKVVLNPKNSVQTKSQLEEIWKKANEPKKPTLPVYKGEKDLTTKILKDLEGKTTVSKQYILDATNRPELKQVERDLIRSLVQGEGDTVNVADFAKKVKAELLPLERKTLDKPIYESITLPSEIRGNVADYKENLYELPVELSHNTRDPLHFRDINEKMYGWTRVEDMADGKTRRVIEIQNYITQKAGKDRIAKELEYFPSLTNEQRIKIEKEGGSIAERNAKTNAIQESLRNEKRKITQYGNPESHFRKIREEIKKAAQDGKTKLQFPTGETAMKIEGLGNADNWLRRSEYATNNFHRINESDLKIGKEIYQPGEQNGWIITDVLGDGKFKAVRKDVYELNQHDLSKTSTGNTAQRNQIEDQLRRATEQFDISGKVDTNNPIYKFYEKDVAKYLNKFGGQRVKDAQGVEWIEVPIKKEWAKMPVEAFAMFPITGFAALREKLRNKKEEKKPISLPPVDTTQQFNRDDFAQRIVSVENEGELARGENVYKTIGVTGDLGKYQVNPQTLKDWSSAWLNKQYTPQEFINDPQAQEKFFKNFVDIVERLQLTPEEAAVTWHLGWGELGTGESREIRDKKFRDALAKRIDTQKAQNYLAKFNR